MSGINFNKVSRNSCLLYGSSVPSNHILHLPLHVLQNLSYTSVLMPAHLSLVLSCGIVSENSWGLWDLQQEHQSEEGLIVLWLLLILLLELTDSVNPSVLCVIIIQIFSNIHYKVQSGQGKKQASTLMTWFQPVDVSFSLLMPIRDSGLDLILNNAPAITPQHCIVRYQLYWATPKFLLSHIISLLPASILKSLGTH